MYKKCFTAWIIDWLFLTRVTRRVPHMEQKLLTLPEQLSSHPAFSGVRVARVFCVVFSTSLFVLFSFFVWPLYCLSLLYTASGYRFGICKIFLGNIMVALLFLKVIATKIDFHCNGPTIATHNRFLIINSFTSCLLLQWGDYFRHSRFLRILKAIVYLIRSSHPVCNYLDGTIPCRGNICNIYIHVYILVKFI